jgi:DNA repair exonuclease SbcCD ATPase subunit
VKIGDLLLLKGFINKKQLQSALSKQAEHAISYDRSVPLGKVLIELEYVTVDEVAEALNDQQQPIEPVKEKEEVMATKIGENTSFQMDLKFLVTIGVVLVSAVGVYFTLTGAVEDNTKEIDNIKSMGDLKIISYKLDEYDETFKDLKSLSTSLTPLATDLAYIKEELNKLKNKKINLPKIDLSGIDECKDKLDEINAKIEAFESRVSKLEKRNSGGSRF